MSVPQKCQAFDMVIEGVMICAGFAATGHGKLALIKNSHDHQFNQNVLETNVRPSVQQLKLGHVIR